MKDTQITEMMQHISPRYTEEAAARAAKAKPRFSLMGAAGVLAGAVMCTAVIGGAIYASKQHQPIETANSDTQSSIASETTTTVQSVAHTVYTDSESAPTVIAAQTDATESNGETDMINITTVETTVTQLYFTTSAGQQPDTQTTTAVTTAETKETSASVTTAETKETTASVTQETEPEQSNYPDGLTASIKSLTSGGCTVLFENHDTDQSYGWGKVYTIYRASDNTVCPHSRIYFNSELCIVAPGQTVPYQINWEPYYGKLPSGDYYILLSAYNNNQQLRVDFTVSGLTASIKSLTSDGCIVLFENHSTDTAAYYGPQYEVYRAEDGTLCEPTETPTFQAVLWQIPAGGSAEIEFSWYEAYGKLPAGSYYVILDAKDSSGNPLRVDFILD